MVGPKIFQDCAFPFSVSLKFTNSLWFSLCLCVTIYVLVYLSTCLSVSMFVTAYALVSLCICICLHVCLLPCLSASLFVSLPVFVRLFCVCLSVCLTVWVSVYTMLGNSRVSVFHSWRICEARLKAEDSEATRPAPCLTALFAIFGYFYLILSILCCFTKFLTISGHF